VKTTSELDRARAPGGAELILYEHDGTYTIRVNGLELMSSRAHGSEERMAELAVRPGARRVLVGGLGLGYTARAVLDRVGAEARVIVAEVVPAVVAWNRTHLAHLAGRPLDDARVTVVEEDVGRVVRAARERFDAILLDVDNGPQALTRPGNQSLYAETGLQTAKAALSRGGVLAVWSADRDEAFLRRLRKVGFTAESHDVPARGVGGGPKHTIFIGRV
jgi:spermidine synthase